ncbi:hypothetical protein CcaverHIS641_0604130 [Cutaneotrichosporon cavernicola]|nr:hypothetical protein CcaverHIS641_0604130 [Cutaneotrichosporon cavernicola]
MESGGTTLAAPTLSTPTITSEPLAKAIDTSALAERAMAPPPTYVTYQASFEPFTTDRSTTPTYRAVNGGGSPSSFLASSMCVSSVRANQPQEWCFWFDRSVTSEEVDARMSNLMTAMLYQFHYHILDTVSGVRFSVMDLLQSVRARLHPHSRGIRWDDEWP